MTAGARPVVKCDVGRKVTSASRANWTRSHYLAGGKTNQQGRGPPVPILALGESIDAKFEHVVTYK